MHKIELVKKVYLLGIFTHFNGGIHKVDGINLFLRHMQDAFTFNKSNPIIAFDILQC